MCAWLHLFCRHLCRPFVTLPSGSFLNTVTGINSRQWKWAEGVWKMGESGTFPLLSGFFSTYLFFLSLSFFFAAAEEMEGLMEMRLKEIANWPLRVRNAFLLEDRFTNRADRPVRLTTFPIPISLLLCRAVTMKHNYDQNVSSLVSSICNFHIGCFCTAALSHSPMRGWRWLCPSTHIL